MFWSGKLSLKNRLVLVVLFILLSGMLVFFGLDRLVSSMLLRLGFVGAALAGAFYTLGMTTPFAMVVVLELMRLENPAGVALAASMSAATVDCLLFSVVRDGLERSTRELFRKTKKRFRGMEMAFPVAGFFVFGLPLPDEIGLALMGITRIDIVRLWFVVFLAKLVTLLIFWKALG